MHIYANCGLISSSAMVKGPTVEPVEMQNVVKKEKYLFEMAASREKYHSLVLEEIENVNRGVCVCV